MSTAVPLSDAYVTVEEYLATEPFSPVRREYLGGIIYDMAGASDAHIFIDANLAALLHAQLRGTRCRSFGSNMKLRLHRPQGAYFYYPDYMIGCDPTDGGDGWRERPSAIFEILSDSTRHTDEREKRLAYLGLASLVAYVRIEQVRPEVAVESPGPDGGWRVERVQGLDGVARLPGDLGMIRLPLAALYEDVVFPPADAAL